MPYIIPEMQIGQLIDMWLADLGKDGTDPNTFSLKGIILDFFEWLDGSPEDTYRIDTELETFDPHRLIAKILFMQDSITTEVNPSTAQNFIQQGMASFLIARSEGEIEQATMLDDSTLVFSEADRADITLLPHAITADEAYQEKAWADLDEVNITGLGLLVEDSEVHNWDMPSQQDIDESSFAAGKRAWRIHQLRSLAARGYLRALAANDDELDITPRFGQCSDEEDESSE